MKYTIFVLLSAILLFSSCSDDNNSDDTDKSLPAKQRMNKYIREKMTSIYYWADDVRDRNVSTELDPAGYFSSYIYKTKDGWSYMDNEFTGPSADISGYDNNFGYEIQFYDAIRFIYGMICYVYPNTPAANAGLKRGDIILKNKGQELTENNINELIYASTAEIELGIYSEDGSLTPDPHVYILSSQKTVINPIFIDSIYQVGGKKIGYIHYTEFADNNQNSLNDLSDVARKFKQTGVDELILDLRYNRGGYLSAAKRFCSLLAPQVNVEKQDVLITQQWNKDYNDRQPQKENLDRSVLGDNLNLHRLYVITGHMTASASEVLISGLQPYLQEIILVGVRTVGKYVGSVSFQPQDDNELKQYTLHPIVFAYRNVSGESVEGGITPNYELKESSESLEPLGNMTEPLLNKTLSLISRQIPAAVQPAAKSLGKSVTPIVSRKDIQRTTLIANISPISEE